MSNLPNTRPVMIARLEPKAPAVVKVERPEPTPFAKFAGIQPKEEA